MRRGIQLVVSCLGILLAGCGSENGTPSTAGPTTSAAVLAIGPTDPALSRGDVDCTPDGLGQDEKTTFTQAYLVVDGKLGQLCLGKESKTLLEAWNLLTTLTPADRLKDLAVFAGFKPGKKAKADDPTYAFVNAVNDAGTLFQMSVNLPEAENDKQEFKFTMAHEFSHVMTTNATQLDRAATGTCATFKDSDGCFLTDSYMADWIKQFWGGGLIEQVDPKVDPTPDVGDPRCKANATFLNSYAASHPEEDFAESFAAFVFRVPLPPQLAGKMAYFAQHPEFAEFQTRATTAGLSPLSDTFDHCG